MNKYILKVWILAAFLSCCQCLFAQKNDYVWLLGSGSDLRTNGDTIDGNVEMNFNYDPVQKSFDSISMNFIATDVSFSDSSGNLLFYSNGIYVANAFDETIENGDSLNFGFYAYNPQSNNPVIGEFIHQGMVVLPNVVNSNQYYILSLYCDTAPDNGGNYHDNYTTKILSNLIDVSANNSHEEVVYKNQPIMNVISGEGLTATKHGNGRDWWIPVQKQTTNCFYVLLMDVTGFHLIDSTCLGNPVTLFQDQARSCFSPDGSKFIYLNITSGLYIYMTLTDVLEFSVISNICLLIF